jgi:hypothetical protein
MDLENIGKLIFAPEQPKTEIWSKSKNKNKNKAENKIRKTKEQRKLGELKIPERERPRVSQHLEKKLSIEVS